ncbi:acetyltransferase [Alicyclobacillus fastidiosus]|uniref:Acetyltransferase n=1 Tax=Alicyclobacillus fastidiosus TaxID=392011 RepID=A0ABY6ZMK3_9BACL|nr:acetyltransferase [Alicyclobacillus fastidiosus]WAH43818.1 acetyltransferase [Alicyclobacillus fastidiosus]GMA60048.1 transferase [Alicyclobacillus fastidiosus]
MANKLVIWGCGGMAREVNWLCQQLGHDVAGYLDERPEFRGRITDGLPVIGDLLDIPHLKDEVHVVCASVGDPALKKKFVDKTLQYGFRVADSLVHPSVFISKQNHIGTGTIICAGAIITTNVRIGDFVIVNVNASLSHDTIVEDYVTISPGATVCGNVTIGQSTFIGAGSTVKEKVRIGSRAVIGGGAFVKDNVHSMSLYAGVPAVFKKDLSVTTDPSVQE